MGFMRSTRSSPELNERLCQMLTTWSSLPSRVSVTMAGAGQLTGLSVVSLCPPCFSEARTMPSGRMHMCTRCNRSSSVSGWFSGYSRADVQPVPSSICFIPRV